MNRPRLSFSHRLRKRLLPHNSWSRYVAKRIEREAQYGSSTRLRGWELRESEKAEMRAWLKEIGEPIPPWLQPRRPNPTIIERR